MDAMTSDENRLALHNTPKTLGGAIPRAVAPEETYARLRTIMPQAGISHLVDLTGLDDLGLPVYLAFGPLPAGADLTSIARRGLAEPGPAIERLLQSVEVFPTGASDAGRGDARMLFSAGKGISALDARVSALMEAVERRSALRPTRPPLRASLRQLQRRGEPLLDPRRLVLAAADQFSEDQPLDWAPAYDLSHDCPIWAPAEAVTYAYSSDCRLCSDTPTGLGAGNTLEEAVSHGLAEAIEHDAWSLAVARSALAAAEAGLSRAFSGAPDLPPGSAAPFLRLAPAALQSVPVVGDLLRQVEAGGAQIAIYAIVSDIPVAAFAVSISGLAGGQDGGGLGAHPDARLALARAITEAAQQRLLLGVHSLAHLAAPARAWKKLAWETLAPDAEKWGDFAGLPSAANLDILDDIHCMLTALQSCGYDQVIVANLEKPGLDMPVVKVLVPGLSDYWTSAGPPDWQSSLNRIQQFMHPRSIADKGEVYATRTS